MRLLFFSDVHGVGEALRQLEKQIAALNPDRLIFLGDALYHGPRNGVPGTYAPLEAAAWFNERAAVITAVRGNCDAEVDQMMLKFPISQESSVILTPERCFFATHGHVWNAEHLPPLLPGSVLAHGHTHLPELRRLPEGLTVFNPGSAALPKGGNPASFGFFDGTVLSIRELANGRVMLTE